MRLTNLYGPVPFGASDRSRDCLGGGGTIFSQYMRAGSTPSGFGGGDVHGVVVDLAAPVMRASRSRRCRSSCRR